MPLPLIFSAPVISKSKLQITFKPLITSFAHALEIEYLTLYENGKESSTSGAKIKSVETWKIKNKTERKPRINKLCEDVVCCVIKGLEDRVGEIWVVTFCFFTLAG